MTTPGKTWKDQNRKRKRVVRTNPSGEEVRQRRRLERHMRKSYSIFGGAK